MLVVSLVLSAGLLALVWVASHSRWATAWLLPPLLVANSCPLWVSVLHPPVAVTAAGCLLALPLLGRGDGGRWYRRAAVGAFVGGWVLAGVTTADYLRRLDRLREVYPAVPLSDRLPPRPTALPGEYDGETLTAVEAELDDDLDRMRTERLQRLHGSQVELFVSSPGFGVGRFLWQPQHLHGSDADRPPVPQPHPSSGDRPANISAAAARRLHLAALLDFSNPRGFGPVVDGRMIGFRPHAFTGVPAADRMTVRRVELVGLLLAPDPRVYVCDHLPNMADLATLPTRHLDGFESPALARLRAGEELVQDAPTGRLLGAVRAAKQCMACHGGDRGDLLGAFSYRLSARTPDPSPSASEGGGPGSPPPVRPAFAGASGWGQGEVYGGSRSSQSVPANG